MREEKNDEVLDFYSGEEVMTLYKVKQSWLYTSAKRNKIPICRIAGKNYYSKKHIDEFFGVAVDISQITQWLTAEQVEELFNMKPTALRAYTYRHKIPTKGNMDVPITPNLIWRNSAEPTLCAMKTTIP